MWDISHLEDNLKKKKIDGNKKVKKSCRYILTELTNYYYYYYFLKVKNGNLSKSGPQDINP